jgi:hypothetical protein
MGQANVRRWVDDLLPLGTDDAGPLGLESFATHRLPLEELPQACVDFQGKRNGTVKVLFKPELRAPPERRSQPGAGRHGGHAARAVWRRQSTG